MMTKNQLKKTMKRKKKRKEKLKKKKKKTKRKKKKENQGEGTLFTGQKTFVFCVTTARSRGHEEGQKI